MTRGGYHGWESLRPAFSTNGCFCRLATIIITIVEVQQVSVFYCFSFSPAPLVFFSRLLFAMYFFVSLVDVAPGARLSIIVVAWCTGVLGLKGWFLLGCCVGRRAWALVEIFNLYVVHMYHVCVWQGVNVFQTVAFFEAVWWLVSIFLVFWISYRSIYRFIRCSIYCIERIVSSTPWGCRVFTTDSKWICRLSSGFVEKLIIEYRTAVSTRFF